MNRRNLETNLETLSFRHKKGGRGGFIRIVATRSDSRFLFHHFCKCAKTSVPICKPVYQNRIPRIASRSSWRYSRFVQSLAIKSLHLPRNYASRFFFPFSFFFFLETRSRSRGKCLPVLSFILLFLSLCFSPSRYRSCASLMIPIGSGRSPRSIPRVYTRETLELRKFLS